jgi:hypothetical protein
MDPLAGCAVLVFGFFVKEKKGGGSAQNPWFSTSIYWSTPDANHADFILNSSRWNINGDTVFF